MIATPDLSVHCAFVSCDASIVTRIVTAAVDQLAAVDDIDIALLDALELPLGEVVEALHPLGIDSVQVATGGRRLHIVLELHGSGVGIEAALEASGEVVSAFFDVSSSVDAMQVELTGSLS